MSSARIHIRLFEEDARCLQELSEVTVCATRSAAIKMSLLVLEMLWAEKRSGNRVVLRNEVLQREHDVFVGSYARPDKLASDTAGNFEVRLSALDLARLNSLLRTDAGLNRSHVIRDAIAVYAHIARRIAERWDSFIVLPGGERTPFRVPGLQRQATEPVTVPEVKSVEARVLRLLPGVGKSRLSDDPELWAWSVPSDLQIQVEELAEKTHRDRGQIIEELVREALNARSSKIAVEPVHVDAVSTRDDAPVTNVRRLLRVEAFSRPIVQGVIYPSNALIMDQYYQGFRELSPRGRGHWQPSDEGTFFWANSVARCLVAVSRVMIFIRMSDDSHESLHREDPHLTGELLYSWSLGIINAANAAVRHEAPGPARLCFQADPIPSQSLISDEDSAILDESKDLEILLKGQEEPAGRHSCSGSHPPRLYVAYQIKDAQHVRHGLSPSTENVTFTARWESRPLGGEALWGNAWQAFLGMPPRTDKRR